MTQYVNRVLSITLVIVLAGVITSAFGYQLIRHELPCPLCFLQRIAMIGIAAGQILNFYFGVQMAHHAISLFHCIFGAAVSLRQIGLHICPGFGKFGTPVLGFSLYTWAFIVFVCSLFVIGVMMYLYDPKSKPVGSRLLKHLEDFAFLYILIIIIADIVSAGLICGIMPCPDNP